MSIICPRGWHLLPLHINCHFSCFASFFSEKIYNLNVGEYLVPFVRLIVSLRWRQSISLWITWAAQYMGTSDTWFFSRFGLEMHVGKSVNGKIKASKTECVFFLLSQLLDSNILFWKKILKWRMQNFVEWDSTGINIQEEAIKRR